jgi:hypothetical protein
MGLHNEYSYDAFAGDDAFEDQEEQQEEEPLHPQDWEDWHSEHLLNLWMGIRAYLDDNGLQHTWLRRANFNTFCQFIRDFS